jgi:hypothetical protein
MSGVDVRATLNRVGDSSSAAQAVPFRYTDGCSLHRVAGCGQGPGPSLCSIVGDGPQRGYHVLPAQPLCRVQLAGGTPTSRLKCLPKWLCWLNPVCRATSAIERPEKSRCFARSMRTCNRN